MLKPESHPYKTWIELASSRLGAQALECSDDFFAEMENLLKPAAPVFIDDKYTDRGKWMDGWESRRSYGRDNGREFDWCIIKLGIAGIVRGVDVDTNFFKGNAPEKISIEACFATKPDEHTQWFTLISAAPVAAHSQNLFEIESPKKWNHLRLNMFPDGGIARFKVYGEASVELPEGELDLAFVRNGGRALLCSDMFFSDKNNLLMPGRGVNMGDGWETKRRRDPGPDWSIIRLGARGLIKRALIDTAHFKGNFPDRFKLQAAMCSDDAAIGESVEWITLLSETPLKADKEHEFEISTDNQGEGISHVKLSIFPDGGVSRMRLMGVVT